MAVAFSTMASVGGSVAVRVVSVGGQQSAVSGRDETRRDKPVDERLSQTANRGLQTVRTPAATTPSTTNTRK
jgi:hypothetical protein